MIKQKVMVAVLFTGLILAPVCGFAETPESTGQDTAAIADRFGQALKDSDEATVRELLDEAVLIFESGSVEASLEEYASHHMGADMTFMSGMQKEVISRQVKQDANIAVVITLYRMFGRYQEREFDEISAETLVLKKSGGSWKITHIHWS